MYETSVNTEMSVNGSHDNTLDDKFQAPKRCNEGDRQHELINDQRDMSVAGYNNAKYPPWRGQRKKTDKIAETVQHKT